MKNIITWAVRNTRLVIAALAVTIIVGVIAFIQIMKELDPDIPIDYIVVQVYYPGISPEDSERLLVKPMENYLRSIQGLKECVITREVIMNHDRPVLVSEAKEQSA